MMVVLVANTKGGCGKTTVATNLAAALASHGRRTALADADRQCSSLEWGPPAPRHGGTNHCARLVEGADRAT